MTMMAQKTLTVHCRTCNHEWTARVPLPLPVTRVLRILRGVIDVGCPACGAFGSDVMAGPKVAAKEGPDLRGSRSGTFKPRI